MDRHENQRSMAWTVRRSGGGGGRGNKVVEVMVIIMMELVADITYDDVVVAERQVNELSAHTCDFQRHVRCEMMRRGRR